MIFIDFKRWSSWSPSSPGQNILFLRNKESYIQCTIPIPFFNWKLSLFWKKAYLEIQDRPTFLGNFLYIELSKIN